MRGRSGSVIRLSGRDRCDLQLLRRAACRHHRQPTYQSRCAQVRDGKVRRREMSTTTEPEAGDGGRRFSLSMNLSARDAGMFMRSGRPPGGLRGER